MISKVASTVSTPKPNVEAVFPRRAAPESVRQAAPLASGARFAVTSGEVAAAPGANPFAGVAAMAVAIDAAPELRLADGAVVSGEACEPTVDALATITHLESLLVSRGVWSAGKVREGLALLVDDAATDGSERFGADRAAHGELARELVRLSAKADAPLVLAKEWHAKLGTCFTGGDVNAFVQQVLREAYLMGTLDLRYFGERVQALNDLKKKIRDEADRVRKLKTAWAKAAKGDPAWVSPTAYQGVTVDSAQMALLPATWAAGDPDLPGAGGDEAGAGSASAADPFFANAPALSKSQRSELVFLKRYDADDLKKKLSAIEEILPSMNAQDVNNFLLPLMNTLKEGGQTGAIVELIEHMTPQQALAVAELGFCPPGEGSDGLSGFKNDEFARIVKVQRNATFTLFGDSVGEDKLGQPVSAAEAVTLMNQLRDRAQETSEADAVDGAASMTETSSVVGTAKTINTVAGLDDYLHELEDKMNTAGDDAQLANVDLQNCLQKQQQTLQLMSNIAKMTHEIAMAIIRNMNG